MHVPRFVVASYGLPRSTSSHPSSFRYLASLLRSEP